MALDLPSVAPPFVHEVLMYEADGFLPRCATSEGMLGVEYGDDLGAGVRLDEADGLLRVLVAVIPHGQPSRWRRPPAVRIGRGEWLSWRINYRFPSAHGDLWTYRLDTFNIAHGPVPARTFRTTAPARRVDERAVLR